MTADAPAAAPASSSKPGGLGKLLGVLETILGVQHAQPLPPHVTVSAKQEGKGGVIDGEYKDGAVQADAEVKGAIDKGHLDVGGSLSGSYTPTDGPISASGKVAADSATGLTASGDVKYKNKDGLSAEVSDNYSSKTGNVASGNIAYDKGKLQTNASITDTNGKLEEKGSLVYGDDGSRFSLDGDLNGKSYDVGAAEHLVRGPVTIDGAVRDTNGQITTKSSVAYAGKDNGVTANFNESSDNKGVAVSADGRYQKDGLVIAGSASDDHGAVTTTGDVTYSNKSGFSGDLHENSDDKGVAVKGDAKYQKGDLTVQGMASDDHGVVTTSSDLTYGPKSGFSADLHEKSDAKGVALSGDAKYVGKDVTASVGANDDHGKVSGKADLAYDNHNGVTASLDGSADQTGYAVAGDVKVKKDKVGAEVGAGVDHGATSSKANFNFDNKHGFSATFGETGTDKHVGFGGSVKETTADGRFAAELDANVDPKGKVQAGGSLHMADKEGDAVDLSASAGPAGFQASATVKIHNVKVGVVLRNSSIVTLTLDLGPKHPKLNEIIQLVLAAASAGAAPIPFAIGTLFRLARNLFTHNPFKHHEKPAQPADGGHEPVAVLLPDDLDALNASGAIHPDGYLNVGLAPDAFNDALLSAGLDGEQHRALLEVWANSDHFLPPDLDNTRLADASSGSATVAS